MHVGKINFNATAIIIFGRLRSAICNICIIKNYAHAGYLIVLTGVLLHLCQFVIRNSVKKMLQVDLVLLNKARERCRYLVDYIFFNFAHSHLNGICNL